MKIIKLFLFAALFTAVCFACQSNENGTNSFNDLSDISGITGVWVCNPESNVTITLTFDSGNVYVNTSPKKLRYANLPNGKSYLFNDGDKYIVRDDTLHYVNPHPDPIPTDYGFVGKMISSNKMELQSYGVVLIALYSWVTDYSFKRK